MCLCMCVRARTHLTINFDYFLSDFFIFLPFYFPDGSGRGQICLDYRSSVKADEKGLSEQTTNQPKY